MAQQHFKPLLRGQRLGGRTLASTLTPLERKPKSQLTNASIYSRATNDAERGRYEIGVGVRKLGMVQRIVKLGAKLKAAFLNEPPEYYRL